MLEYPDITVYIERLEALVVGQPLEKIRFISTFFLRTAEPPIQTIHDSVVRDNGFPDKVTAFRKNMAVHGCYKKPCPDCGTAIQRIRYAANETNYCPLCQTGGKIYADRALSRLLKKDWPRTLEELEIRKQKLNRTFAQKARIDKKGRV